MGIITRIRYVSSKDERMSHENESNNSTNRFKRHYFPFFHVISYSCIVNNYTKFTLFSIELDKFMCRVVRSSIQFGLIRMECT